MEVEFNSYLQGILRACQAASSCREEGQASFQERLAAFVARLVIVAVMARVSDTVLCLFYRRSGCTFAVAGLIMPNTICPCNSAYAS